MSKRRLTFLSLAVLPLLALACGETYRSSGYRTATATPTMGGLAGAYLEAELAAGERQRAESQATAQAALVALTVQAAAVAEDAAQAVLQAQAAATAQAINARATMQALDAQATAQAVALEATRAAEARNATATAEAGFARATATAEARRVTASAEAERATATARSEWATATAAAYRDGLTATADAHSWAQTATAEAVAATVQAAALEREALALQRERVTQPLRTWGPWVLLSLAVIGMILLVRRAAIVLDLRGRAVPRDPRGDAPILMLPQTGGGVVVLDPDRALWPATVIDGEVRQPQLAPPEVQERTTARDQAVDLATRCLPGRPAPRGRRLPPAVLRPGPPASAAPAIRVVRPERVLPWIEEVEGQLVEEDE